MHTVTAIFKSSHKCDYRYSVPDKCNTLPAKAHIDAGDYSYQDPLSVYSLADSLRESDTPIHYDTLPSNHHMGKIIFCLDQ